jgi:hypothetical protein
MSLTTLSISGAPEQEQQTLTKTQFQKSQTCLPAGRAAELKWQPVPIYRESG